MKYTPDQNKANEAVKFLMDAISLRIRDMSVEHETEFQTILDWLCDKLLDNPALVVETAHAAIDRLIVLYPRLGAR